MRIPKIVLNYGRLPDNDFAQKASHILDSMTDNPFFETPEPPLSVLAKAVADFDAALTAADKLGKLPVAAKDKSRDALAAVLYHIGTYVTFVANGDATILTSSGFTLVKVPEAKNLGDSGMARLTNGLSSGELLAVIGRQPAAKGYVFEISDELPSEKTLWKANPTSRCKWLFTNLVPGRQVWVRVGIIGRDNQLVYSPVSTRFVQ